MEAGYHGVKRLNYCSSEEESVVGISRIPRYVHKDQTRQMAETGLRSLTTANRIVNKDLSF
jgi:hypothetical protein